MNQFNFSDDQLHGLAADFSDLIKQKGLDGQLSLAQIHFGAPLATSCHQVPVCQVVTDPLTHQPTTICHLETVCD